MISLRSKITQSILGYWMLHEDAEMYVREMSRRLRLDDSNLAKKLCELETAGILKSRERGREKYYSLNRAFPLLKEYRQIILKTVGFEQQIREVLAGLPAVEQAYIFGSYAGGKMDAWSDIDLLVVGAHDTLLLQKKIALFQKKMDREINVISMDAGEYQRKVKKDPFLKSLAKKKKVRLL